MSRSIALTVVLIAAALSGVAPLSAQQAAPARISVPYHDVHAAERADRHPSRRSQRADRRRQRLVSRRIGQRETGPHRLRAPLRAPDVRGVEERQGRRRSTRCSKRPAAATTRRPPNDRTNYYIDVPANALDLALFLESDRMGYLLDIVSENMVNGQRDVVKNERRQSVENAPYGMAGVRIPELMYPKNHPYHWPVIGYMEDLTAASAEDVREFFRKYYAPQNASLVVAGDINPAEARKKNRILVRRREARQERGPDRGAAGRPDGRRQGDADRPRPAAAAVPRLDHAGALLARRRRARRRRERACRRQELAALQAAGVRPAGRAGRLVVPGLERCSARCSSIDVTARPSSAPPDQTLEKLKTIVDEEIAEAARRAAGRTRSAARAQPDRVVVLQPHGARRRLRRQGRSAERLPDVHAGNPDYFNEDLARYRALQPNDVQAAVRRWLPADRRVELIVVPAAKEGGQ